MKKIKPKKNQILFRELDEDDVIQIINMNDYFDYGIPQPGRPQRVVEFTSEFLVELIEEGATPEEAFNYFHQGSGDGGENFCVVTIRHGEVYTVIRSAVEEW